MPHVDHEGVAARGAARLDGALLLQDLEVGLGVVALLAQHKLLDEDVKHVLQAKGNTNVTYVHIRKREKIIKFKA